MKNSMKKYFKVLTIIIISNLLCAGILTYLSTLNFIDSLFMTGFLTVLGGIMILIDEPPLYKEIYTKEYYKYIY